MSRPYEKFVEEKRPMITINGAHTVFRTWTLYATSVPVGIRIGIVSGTNETSFVVSAEAAKDFAHGVLRLCASSGPRRSNPDR